ncbi:aminotransferase class I/II-fold pyridoxal phosphate-dependent enzyme, partial [Staphylococcus aureus]|uniref:aminotransferase class I/II-fold pyridoxal phosphate-dependent enzyme n=1 Tax=Staphylococcus aureus TaxID=1280 RepID=UPI000F082ACA
PSHNWGNYKLIFNTRHSANIETYSIFDHEGHYTTNSLVSTLKNYNQDKVTLILNYPNNPTGYTPTSEEVATIVSAIEELANKGTKVITVVDDAYYGLFYEDVPSHNWGNYKLIFNTRHSANIETYSIFDHEGHYT